MSRHKRAKRFYDYSIWEFVENMLTMRLLTLFKGKFTGKDRYGNCYYKERFFVRSADANRPRRWVMFKGPAEGSKVPPEWHGWLHHATDQPPTGYAPAHEWELPYQPNLTGTPHAYRPHNLTTKQAVSKKALKNYTPWTPV